MEEELKKKLKTDYKGKYLSITQKGDQRTGNFALKGEIEDVYGDFVQFKTGIQSSLININNITQIKIIERPTPPLFEKTYKIGGDR